jgi:hypothetical protein
MPESQAPTASTLFRQAVVPGNTDIPPTYPQIEAWLRRSVETGRSGLPQVPDDDVADPLIRLYPELDGNDRNYLATAVLALLIDYAKNSRQWSAEEWTSKESSVRSLLSLVRHVDLRSDGNDFLRDWVKDYKLFRTFPRLVQNDLLGLLIDLPIPLDAAFWRELAMNDLDLLGPVAFGALADTDFQAALDLLVNLPPSPKVQIGLRLRIPWLLGRMGWRETNGESEERREQLAKALRSLPLFNDLFREEFERLGAPLPRIVIPKEARSPSEREELAVEVLGRKREYGSTTDWFR